MADMFVSYARADQELVRQGRLGSNRCHTLEMRRVRQEGAPIPAK